MYYSQTTEKGRGVFRATCSACGKEANFLLKKQETSGCLFIIPLWGDQYFATCGNCFTAFKIDKKLGRQLENASPVVQQEKEEEKAREEKLKNIKPGL